MYGTGAPKNEEFVNPLIPIYKEYDGEEGRKRTQVEWEVGFNFPYIIVNGFYVFTDEIESDKGGEHISNGVFFMFGSLVAQIEGHKGRYNETEVHPNPGGMSDGDGEMQ
jgi:hypothetical protein